MTPEDVQAAVARAERLAEQRRYWKTKNLGGGPWFDEEIAACEDVIALASRLAAETARADAAEEACEVLRVALADARAAFKARS